MCRGVVAALCLRETHFYFLKGMLLKATPYVLCMKAFSYKLQKELCVTYENNLRFLLC